MSSPVPPLNLGPRWLREKINELSRRIEDCKPVPGIGINISDGPGGKAISSISAVSGNSNSGIAHPFKTYIRPDPDNAGQFQAMVESGSNVYNGLGNWGNTSVTGLGAWFNAVENDYIYLAGTVSSGTVTGIYLGFGQTLPGRIVLGGDPPEQTGFSYLIARIRKDANGDMYVEQNCFTHLTLLDVCLAGVSCKYPFAV